MGQNICWNIRRLLCAHVKENVVLGRGVALNLRGCSLKLNWQKAPRSVRGEVARRRKNQRAGSITYVNAYQKKTQRTSMVFHTIARSCCSA